MVACEGVWRDRQEEGIAKEHKGIFGNDNYVQYFDRVDGFRGVYVKIYQIVLLTYAKFIFC